MTEINKKLRSSLLPAPMIIKNYVEGDENCNYEKYLLEIVNASEIYPSRRFRISWGILISIPP